MKRLLAILLILVAGLQPHVAYAASPMSQQISMFRTAQRVLQTEVQEASLGYYSLRQGSIMLDSLSSPNIVATRGNAATADAQLSS
jgi:hypothetical protein